MVNLTDLQVNQMRAHILKTLRESGNYVSGERLSKRLGISRVSVWKHIRNLRQDGYVVEASPRGYRLVSSPDLLLPCEFPEVEHKIHYFREIGSTMIVARELAKRRVEEGTMVIAESQFHGRGRLTREWLSPEGGIYFTIILKPEISPAYAPRINLMASVAVARAIREVCGLKAELKWPNDVLIKGKKVCGILAEMEAEVDAINFINLGIGINVNASIPQYEKGATSLKDELGEEVPRKELLKAVLKEINKQQALLTGDDLLKEWKTLSATLNRQVRIMMLGGEVMGRAIDIDSNGALVLRREDGSLRSIIAGDCIHLD